MKFVEKMAKFQDSRFPWALLVFVSVALVVIAHSLFQNYAYMPPCEQCFYIRFAFLCMALGGVIAMINPKNLLFAIIGYVFAFWGAVQGIMYSVKLAKIQGVPAFVVNGKYLIMTKSISSLDGMAALIEELLKK